MQEQERHIKELLELTMEIARETEHCVSFELSTSGELTNLHIFDTRGGEVQKVFAIYPYIDIGRDEYNAAKKYLEAILETEVPQ